MCVIILAVPSVARLCDWRDHKMVQIAAELNGNNIDNIIADYVIIEHERFKPDKGLSDRCATA